MGEKKTWGNFIKKLIVQIITVFVFWAVGSNFVHVIGRSKPNKGNRYSPGHWDWPHDCSCYPYFNSVCLNRNNLAETTQWIEKHANISHGNEIPQNNSYMPPTREFNEPNENNPQSFDIESEEYDAPPAQPMESNTVESNAVESNTVESPELSETTNKLLRENVESTAKKEGWKDDVIPQNNSDESKEITSNTPSENEKVNTSTENNEEKGENPSENILTGGGKRWASRQFRKFKGRKRNRNQIGGANDDANKEKKSSNEQPSKENVEGDNSKTNEDEPDSVAKSILGLKEQLQKRIIEEIFNDFDDYYVDGYAGESVVGPDPKLVAKWEAKNNKEAKNPILRAFIQTRNESVAKAETWLNEAESKVMNGTWTEDYQLDDPVPQTLGPIGKLYLYTPLSTDEYGFPYSLQQDGRKLQSLKEKKTSSSNVCIRPPPVGESYSDGTLFGNPDLKSKDILKSAAASARKGGKKKNMNSSPENMNSSPENMNSSPENMDSSPENIDSLPENMDSSPENIDSLPENIDSLPENNQSGGAKEDKTLGGEGLSEEIPEMPEGILEGLYNFCLGGWIKLFTQGAPDIFGWVQEKSWIFHRWLIYTCLRFLATFYAGKPTGLSWIYIAFLIHIGPITIMSSLLPQLIGWISYIYTFIQYYLYGITKDNHLLTGWTWAGNFLFLPIVLGVITGWIPILNIITIPLSIILSFLPSLQTWVMPAITSFFQTIRSVLFLAFGHIFTPTGSQHYLGNILNIDRFRGLFILEMVIMIVLVILNHLPTSDYIRNATAFGVGVGWLIFQIIVLLRKRSGWNALIGR